MKLALAPLALAVVLAAGCGGGGSSSSSSSPSPKDWADGLCSAITTWSTSVSQAGQKLKGGNLSKDSLKTTTTEIKDATSHVRRRPEGPRQAEHRRRARRRRTRSTSSRARSTTTSTSCRRPSTTPRLRRQGRGQPPPRASPRTLSTMSTQIAAAVFEAAAGRREGRARAGLQRRPGLQEAQRASRRLVPRMRETSSAITVTR